jgi:hypothetical protein
LERLGLVFIEVSIGAAVVVRFGGVEFSVGIGIRRGLCILALVSGGGVVVGGASAAERWSISSCAAG